MELTKNLLGDYVQVGVYLGGTALTALNYSKFISSPARKYLLLDTFNGFENNELENSKEDISWEGTHQFASNFDSITYMRETLNISEQPFELLRGNVIMEDFPSEIERISLAHIDVDSDQATFSALTKIAPWISQGGIMMLEDPPGTPALYGSLFAMHQFLSTEMG